MLKPRLLFFWGIFLLVGQLYAQTEVSGHCCRFFLAKYVVKRYRVLKNLMLDRLLTIFTLNPTVGRKNVNESPCIEFLPLPRLSDL